jgi:indian hedgehog protein
LNGGAPVTIGSVSFCLCGLFYKGPYCETFTDYSGARCFPETTKVEKIDKQLINISELKYGDYIKSYDINTNKWIYSKFMFYLHNDKTIKTKYISIKTSTNKTLFISKYHLIPIKSLNDNDIKYIFANELKLNDILIPNEYIIELNEIYQYGAYAPLLESGTILVNDILASCYANTKWHNLVHFVFQPIIKLYNIININDYQLTIDNESNNNNDDNIFWYARYLYSFFKYVPYSESFIVF